MSGMGLDHNANANLVNRWLEAVSEPDARIYSLPGGLEMLDISGNGDARLVAADLGTGTSDTAKVRVFDGRKQITERNMLEPPCGIVGFHSENGEPRTAALAVGAGSSVYVYKNMRPHFKYRLPHVDAHPREREIWHNAGLGEELNVLTLGDELESLLKELGAALLSPRTLKFLSMDRNLRPSFAEEYRRVPLVRDTAVTCLGTVRKDSWNDPASSCLAVGSEAGEILILDPRAFSVTDKLPLGWPPVALAGTGLWGGDGRIIVVGRGGKLGAVGKGCALRLWDELPAPAVSLATLASDGAAVCTMDGTLWGFSKKGVKVWQVQLAGIALDLVSLPVPQDGLSLLAVSVAGHGIRVYNGHRHVDTIKTSEPISAIKYGRLGQEERAMAMVTIGGGLSVKILKRTADFSVRRAPGDAANAGAGRWSVPRKTRLFVEQTIRERTEAPSIHETFQRGLLRLRLAAAERAVDVLTIDQNSGPSPVLMESSVLGLGPRHLVRICVTNIADGPSDAGLFVVCRDEDADVRPRVVDLPLLPSGVPVAVTVEAALRAKGVPGKVQSLLCKRGWVKPLAITCAFLPVSEEEMEV